MNNEKISGFKRNHAGGDEKLVVNKCWPNRASVDFLTHRTVALTSRFTLEVGLPVSRVLSRAS